MTEYGSRKSLSLAAHNEYHTNAYKSYLDYIKGKFKEKGVEILRVTHDYKSLDTAHPQLGVVVLAGDSVVEDRTEVWVLIGHNARYIDQVEVRGQEA